MTKKTYKGWAVINKEGEIVDLYMDKEDAEISRAEVEYADGFGKVCKCKVVIE